MTGAGPPDGLEVRALPGYPPPTVVLGGAVPPPSFTDPVGPVGMDGAGPPADLADPGAVPPTTFPGSGSVPPSSGGPIPSGGPVPQAPVQPGASFHTVAGPDSPEGYYHVDVVPGDKSGEVRVQIANTPDGYGQSDSMTPEQAKDYIKDRFDDLTPGQGPWVPYSPPPPATTPVEQFTNDHGYPPSEYAVREAIQFANNQWERIGKPDQSNLPPDQIAPGTFLWQHEADEAAALGIDTGNLRVLPD